MKKIKIILKYFDKLDQEISKECLSIEEYIRKIDREINEEWKDFKKVVSIKFRIFDENGQTITKDNCSKESFKKECVVLKNKMN